VLFSLICFFLGSEFVIWLPFLRYHCRVTRIYPPASVRGLAASSPLRPQITGDSMLNGGNNAEQNVDDLAHCIGTNLDVPPEEAARLDPPGEYLYTVQLMDEESKFEGSFMEAKSSQLRFVLYSSLPLFTSR
jgi:bromodomain adjacent to zinc finger domain protein 1A